MKDNELLPFRARLLDYMSKVDEASPQKAMEDLREEYGHKKYFTKEKVIEDFLSMQANEQVVQTNSARCIGCQSCVSACPFGMITIQSLPGDTRQQIVKCDLCEQREEGPACVESCPTQALQLLTERELRRVRQQRIVASGENPL